MNPLFAVRDALRAHAVATPAQLAAELALPRAVVDDVLAHWLRRGCAQQVLPNGGACSAGCCGGGCGGCASGMQAEAFRWLERARPLQRMDPVLARPDGAVSD